MSANPFEELEEKYDEIVNKMPDDDDGFDSHKFILALSQKYQRLYIEALYTRRDKNRPFHNVHMEIARRLKKRRDLVKHIDSKSSLNIFDEQSKVAVWRKVKK